MWDSKPALGDIIDLGLDGHEQGLLGIGAVVGLELLRRDLAELNRGAQRRHLLLLGVAVAVVVVVGGTKKTRDDVVSGKKKRQHREEGGRREAGVGHDGLLQGFPQLHSHHSLVERVIEKERGARRERSKKREKVKEAVKRK